MSERTILVVDDDPDFRELVTSIVVAQGHSVVQAAGSREGAELAARIPLALAVVDMFLPGELPGAAIESVREAAPGVPLVCVSATWADYGILRRGERDDAMRLMVHKPINPVVFGRQISEILLGRGTGRHPRPASEPIAGLASLTREFEQRLPQLVAEILDAVVAVLADSGAAPLLNHARTLAHRLHGTAGSYGFARVGRAAAEVERLLDAEGGDPVSERGALEGALRQLALEVEPGAELEPAGAAGGSAASVAKLLVVDDDPSFGAFVCSIAERLLVRALSARSREEALALAGSWQPDAVLIDVWLAANDQATDLATALRDIPGLEDLPIAFVSKDDRAATRVAAARAGGALYLTKPLDAEMLENALRVLMRERIARASTVLLVDDDAQRRELMIACVESLGMRAVALTDSRLLFQYLGDVGPDAVVLHGLLPRVSGFDACRAIRAAPRWQELPIVLVTRGDDADLRVAAFQSGADDHLDLSSVARELGPRLRVRIDRARAARERSERDSLTGLLLRGAFLDALHRRAMEADREKGSVAIALLDIDDFKLVNDSHGHPAGDRTLATLANTLRGALRGSDIIGRWGGDEFIVAMPGEGLETARAAIDRALAAFTALRLAGAGGGELKVTVSAGAAVYPADGSRIDDVVGAADKRLYEAKRGRRA